MGKAHASAYCLAVLLLIMCSDLAWSIKGGGANRKINKPRKPTTPKPSTAPHDPGFLVYYQKRLNLNLSDTEDDIYYASNFSQFPNEVFYPWNPQANTSVLTTDVFVDHCFNTTVAKNSLKLMDSGGLDVHRNVMVQIIKHLCLMQYGKVPSAAAVHVGMPLLLPIVLWLTSVGH